jgi:hypothetical protein
MRRSAAHLLPLCVLLLAGCGGNANPSDRPLDVALPALDQLDRLFTGDHAGFRAGSAVQDAVADVTQPLDFRSGQPVGASWSFQPQAASPTWALYRLPAPAAGTALLNLRAQGSAELWMAVADYGAERWQFQKMSAGLTQVDLQTGNWVSPGSGIYCAFILPQNSVSSPQLTSLDLRFDDNIVPQGPQYYVAPPANGGDDANDGSQVAPWATLQHAADVVVAGDTVNVLAGNYAGFMLQTCGAAGAPIKNCGRGTAPRARRH